MNELRQKSRDELGALLTQRYRRIAELRFLLKQKKVKNIKEPAALRKDVARILTFLRKNPTANT